MHGAKTRNKIKSLEVEKEHHLLRRLRWPVQNEWLQTELQGSFLPANSFICHIHSRHRLQIL